MDTVTRVDDCLCAFACVHTRQDWQAIFLCADKSENTMTRKPAFTSNQSQTHRFLSLTANGQTCQNLRIFFQRSTSNQVIDGSLPEVDIALMFARAKDAMTGQAKAEVHHPFGKVLSYFQTLTRKNNLSICKGKGIREGNWS
jgi:hypothetical protein